jgi:hypothetical protein
MLAKGEEFLIAANVCSDTIRYPQKSAKAIVPGNLSIFLKEVKLQSKGLIKEATGRRATVEKPAAPYYAAL